MKKATILLLVLATTFACKNEKYNKMYDSWKTEMIEINTGHTEALSILDRFKQKIDGHKKRLKDFTTLIETETTNGTKSDMKLEEDILKKANLNIKKHEHFSFFLNNLSALQGVFEDKPFELYSIPNESDIKKFNSLKEATSFWITEKDNINAGHNKALSIVSDLENHIHNHQKAIKEFTQKFGNEPKDKKAMTELENNYNSNKKKHNHFVSFLGNLKQVQQEFEGK
jgi:hypothetical protein